MAKQKAKKEEATENERGSSANRGVDLAIKEIQQKYGEGSIMKLGDARKVDVDVIPSG